MLSTGPATIQNVGLVQQINIFKYLNSLLYEPGMNQVDPQINHEKFCSSRAGPSAMPSL
jgi:hypothetical protein